MGIAAAAPWVLGGLGVWGASKDQQRADGLNERAQEQVEREFAEREPLRRLGLQQLGQIERPMDLGNLGFDEFNPYAAARGPSPSTATYGNWGEMTYDPAQDPNRTERVMLDQQQPQIDRVLERSSKLPGGGRLAQDMRGQLEQRRQGLQPLGNPFGFGGDR